MYRISLPSLNAPSQAFAGTRASMRRLCAGSVLTPKVWNLTAGPRLKTLSDDNPMPRLARVSRTPFPAEYIIV